MSNSVWPHSWQPTSLPHPWDSPGKNTGVGCHFLLQCRKMKSESEVAQSCPTLIDPMDCSLPLSMQFSRLEYWSEVLLPLHDEITSHLHYIVFLSFFALITEEGFLRTNNRKVLADPLPQYTSFKVRLVRWFLLRSNISPSKIHCYIN